MKIRRLILAFLLCFSLTSGVVSCASKRKASAEIVQTQGDSTVSNGATTTRVTVDAPPEEHESEGKGLFGILGDIIALPFRLLGALF